MPTATERRLLEAAGEVFSDQGFRNATVREICRRAGANVAAVNYYFGGKEGLYREVLRDSFARALEQYPPQGGLKPGASPQERLHAFVRAMLLRCLSPGRPAWHGKLMVREMAEPTGALDDLVRDFIRPNYETLQGIVRSIAGPGLNGERLRLACTSVVGQCLFHRFAQPVIRTLMPKARYSLQEIDRLALFIAEFSLRALRPQRSAAR